MSGRNLQALSADIERIAAATAPSIVAVHSRHARSSGFVWRSGLVITADEALAEEGEIAIRLPGGSTVPATLAGRDPTTDIALLRIEGLELAPIALSGKAVSVGGLTTVLGSHDGFPVASLGIVSLSGPSWGSMRGGEIDARIELDMSIARFAEGGLALDASGCAFGMAVFGPRRRVLVIPVATIDRVAARLEADGYIARGYLGLGLQPVRLAEGGAGAMVMSVDKDGPGAAAGIFQGDIIVAWDGEPINGVHTMLRLLGPDSVGRTAALTARRSGASQEFALTVGDRPRG